jgi:hypothetical protein
MMAKECFLIFFMPLKNDSITNPIAKVPSDVMLLQTISRLKLSAKKNKLKNDFSILPGFPKFQRKKIPLNAINCPKRFLLNSSKNHSLPDGTGIPVKTIKKTDKEVIAIKYLSSIEQIVFLGFMSVKAMQMTIRAISDLIKISNKSLNGCPDQRMLSPIYPKKIKTRGLYFIIWLNFLHLLITTR